MKKLLIAMMVAGAAVLANAGSVTWGTGAMYFNGDGSALNDTTGKLVGSVSGTSAAAYLFILGTVNNSTTEPAAYLALTTSAGIWDNFTESGASSTLKAGDTTFTATGYSTTVSGGNIDFDETSSARRDYIYAALIVTYKDENGKDFYSANTAYLPSASTAGGDMSVAALGWGEYGEGTATTWTAVPEPTSGLLLLLGMAGLALKRKRA